MTLTDHSNHRPFVARTILFAAAFFLSHSPFQAHANDRVALVVGIDSYSHATPLNNAVSDSRLVSKVLRETGFNVVALENPGVDEFYEGLDKLSRRASLAQVGIVYFAGHGVEVGGENYLLPVDAKLEREVQLRSQAISLETILDDLGDARLEAKVVILDCCRDNPLKQRSWMKTRSAGRGLAPILDVKMPEGSLVFFSAGPGQVALDGDDGNSPFTKALASQLLIPGQDLFGAVINTSDNVADETGGRQEPWVKMDASGRALRKLVLVPVEKTPADSVGTVTTIAGAPTTGNHSTEPVKPENAPAEKKAETATAASTTAKADTVQVGNQSGNVTPAPPADSMKETVAANTTPGAEGAAEPTSGNMTGQTKEEVKPLVLPTRGYFNNTEVFESGPYSGYNSYSKNKILRSAQGKLTGAGTPDGIMGRKTQSALQAYQTANSIPVTGKLDIATLAAIGLTGLPEETYVAPKKTYTPKKTYSKPSSSSSSSGTRSSGSSSGSANRSSGSSNSSSSQTRRAGPMMPPGFPPAPRFPHPMMKKFSSSGSSSGGYSPPKKKSSRVSHARKKFMRPG